MTLAAGTRARRRECEDRLEHLLDAADWTRLATGLAGARLLPTLGPRLLAAASDAAPAAFSAAVDNSVLACQRQDVLLAITADLVRTALGKAGVRSSVLKGPGLGEQVYGQPGRRLSGDVDLLVPAEQLASAAEVVVSLGYRPPTDPVFADGLPLLHFAFAHQRREMPPIELHWRIHWYEGKFAERRLLAPAGAVAGRRPELPDQLASLLLYYARDGFTGLRQASDVAAWWDRFGDSLEPGALGAVAADFPELRPALLAASRVAERSVGLPAGRLFEAGARLGFRERLAVRLADPRPYASKEQLFAEIGLIDGLLSPPGTAWDFARRQIAPPREVIRDHAEKAQGGKSISPLGYSARTLGRYSLAIGRLLGVPLAERARFSD